MFWEGKYPKAYELKQTIIRTCQVGATVSTYDTNLQGIWDEMQSVLAIPCYTCHGCTRNIERQMVELREKQKLYEFLMGLNSEFSVIQTQVLSMHPIPILGNAYHLIA